MKTKKNTVTFVPVRVCLFLGLCVFVFGTMCCVAVLRVLLLYVMCVLLFAFVGSENQKKKNSVFVPVRVLVFVFGLCGVVFDCLVCACCYACAFLFVCC